MENEQALRISAIIGGLLNGTNPQAETIPYMLELFECLALVEGPMKSVVEQHAAYMRENGGELSRAQMEPFCAMAASLIGLGFVAGESSLANYTATETKRLH